MAVLYSENFGFCLSASQDLFMENVCGLDHMIPQPQPFDQFQSFQNQKNLSNFLVGDNNVEPLNPASMAFSQRVSAHVEKQRLEFEQFLNLQNERLRLAMQEQRKQQTAVLVKKYETKCRVLLKQKDDEIAKAANRTMELQNFLKRMEMESQTWQRAAMENEATVASLNGTIQRLRESVCNAADDAESCCMNMGEAEGHNGKIMCRCCNSRRSCVVILPCRHLCCCKDCEVFLHSCPLCNVPKKATIEALI